MALPTNTNSTAGIVNPNGTGIRNSITVNAPSPRLAFRSNGISGNAGSGSGLQSGSFGADGQVIPSGGSGSFQFGLFGKPKANGIEKALGALGTGLALVQAASSLIEAGEGVLENVKDIAKQAKAFGDSLFSDAKAAEETLKQELSELDKTFLEESNVKANVTTKPLKSDWRVRIGVNNLRSIMTTATAGYLEPLTRDGKNSVIFPYTPQITVIHKANYNTQSPIHNNYNFYSYKNSSVDDIVINSTFTVSNEDEGRYWLAATKFFKVLTKSFYGESFPNGFPPIVAQLYGYGDHMFGGTDGGLNIVVKSVAIDLPRNVQYKRIVFGKKGKELNYVPLESNITLTVSPVFNRTKLRSFNLNDYANGGQTGII